MPVLLKCVWLAEGNSTCGVGNLDMSRCSWVDSKFLFWEGGSWTCRVGHFDMLKIPRAKSKFELQDRGTLDMSSGVYGHVEMDLG